MWTAPKMTTLEELRLIRGFDKIIKEIFPDLTMYLTMDGWERKKTYE